MNNWLWYCWYDIAYVFGVLVTASRSIIRDTHGDKLQILFLEKNQYLKKIILIWENSIMWPYAFHDASQACFAKMLL